MKNQDKQFLTAAAVVAGALLIKNRSVSGVGKVGRFSLRGYARQSLAEELALALGGDSDYTGFVASLSDGERRSLANVYDYASDDYTYRSFSSANMSPDEKDVTVRFAEYVLNSDIYNRRGNYDLMDAIDKIRG